MPAAFGSYSKIKDADDVKAVDSSNYEDKGFRDHLSTIQHRYTDKDGKIHKMKMSDAVQEGRLGNRARENWQKGERELAKKSSAENLVKMPAQSINMNVVNNENFTPEVASKVLSKGSDQQITQAANRSDIRESLAGENLARVKAEGTAIENDKDRTNFRSNLYAVTSHGADQEGAQNAFRESFDITPEERRRSDGTTSAFDTDQAEQDFRSAVSGDASLSDQVDFSNKDSALAQTAVASMGSKEVGKMISDWESFEGTPEQEEAMRQRIEGVLSTAGAGSGRIAQSPPNERTPQEKRDYKAFGRVISYRQTWARSQRNVDQASGRAPRPAAPIRPAAPAAPAPAAEPTEADRADSLEASQREAYDKLSQELAALRTALDDAKREYSTLGGSSMGEAKRNKEAEIEALDTQVSEMATEIENYLDKNAG